MMLQREDGDLVQVLFWLAFFLVPLIARGIQSIKKAQEARSRPTGAAPVETPRQRIEELERAGDEAWKRLFEEAEAPAPVEVRPAPVASLEGPARKAVSLEDLGRGLEAEVSEVSIESEGPEVVARESLASELSPTGAAEKRFVAFDAIGAPAVTGEGTGAPSPAVETPGKRPSLAAAALLDPAGWSWRTAFLTSEILGPPLCLRSTESVLGEPSTAFGLPGSSRGTGG